MPSVVHVVATGNFAGVERYVCDVANESAARGWQIWVVGGDREQMSATLSDGVRWLPGASWTQALRSLARIGRTDLCHAHMTIAEAVSVAARPLHRSPIISTRHFAAPRGSSTSGRLLAPWITSHLEAEIAISDFVADRLERPPTMVIRNAVPPSPYLWQRSSRTVLVLQRLEREKDTLTALRAWQAARLAQEGWSLRVVGEGSQRADLERWVKTEAAQGVEFAGWSSEVSGELAGAAVLLAPAPAEPFGLGVLEAMAAGVPVVASASGGHLETIGRLPDAPSFPVADVVAAAAALRSLVPDDVRLRLSHASRALVDREFGLAAHVDRLIAAYESVLERHGSSESIGSGPATSGVA